MRRVSALLLVVAVALAVVAPGAGASPKASGNIVQTAVAAGQFKTLVSLVKKAGLVGALSGKAKLTVFAPTDAAFAAVPKATLAKLAANPAKLKAVLLYHVVKGKVTAAQAMKLHSATTLEGQQVKIATRGGAVYVNAAKVVKADVMASNGVIHVINKVLLPPSM
jgi:uncharacterized surface protein with fasciclin (FAS1) repeats